MTRIDNQRHIAAPTGTDLSAKSWLTEAPLRMLMNNLDARVAENPQELVVYGGIGRAARDWESYDRIVETLKRLEGDETLLIQSGKPVGVFRTHENAPRVLLANSNLVPEWANWEHFHELDKKGLMMYGQMTAGSWIYIGSQGIVQGTYETFVEMGRQHYGGDLSGRWLLTAGLGGMGGAQPLASVMAGASCLAIECQRSRIDMRLKSGYLDHATDKLDEALGKKFGKKPGVMVRTTQELEAVAANAPFPDAKPNFQLLYFGFKTTRPMVADRRVREAMSIAINRAEIAKGVLLGNADPAFTIVDADALDHDPGTKDIVKEDIERAKALLDEAGWKMGSDGVRQGYDIEQLRAVRERCAVPLVASGGAGTIGDFTEVFRDADADAALAASVFHSGAVAIPELKRHLRAQGIEVRDVG